MRARRHSRLYAAALHPVMRAYVRRRRTDKCNCTVFYGLYAAFQMHTVLESGRGFFSAPRVT